MADWLETSPPNNGVEGSNPRGLKCDNRKDYIGGWIYPEYSVAWLIPAVGFMVDSVVFTLRGRPEVYSHALEGDCHDDEDLRL